MYTEYFKLKHINRLSTECQLKTAWEKVIGKMNKIKAALKVKSVRLAACHISLC